jgi:hypothetical protein
MTLFNDDENWYYIKLPNKNELFALWKNITKLSFVKNDIELVRIDWSKTIIIFTSEVS